MVGLVSVNYLPFKNENKIHSFSEANPSKSRDVMILNLNNEDLKNNYIRESEAIELL